MPLLDWTMGGGTAFVTFLLPLTLAPRGRNKKYHTRKRAMAKPCRIMMVVCFVARADDEIDDPSAVERKKTNDEQK
jgi:hypothetical protein